MNRLLTPLAALLLVSLLAGCTTITTSAPRGELAVSMTTEPATPLAGAAATMVFTVVQGGQPLAGARVLVVRRMIGIVHPDDDFVFESVDEGNGRYSAATAFATPGEWDVQVVVTPAGGEALAASFALIVAQP